jgi:hypothetical protein
MKVGCLLYKIGVCLRSANLRLVRDFCQTLVYFVDWIAPVSPFSDETMQIRGGEGQESCSRVVQYCLEPLIHKAVYESDRYNGFVVIVPAVVVCAL